MMNKIKILFIIWSHSYGGGAEALLTMIVNGLNPEQYEISLIEVFHSHIKTEKTNSNIKILDPITSESDPDYTKKMYYLYHDPDAMIDRYIPQDYDLYVSFNYQLPSFLLPKGKKNIAWIHGSLYNLQVADMEGARRCQSLAFEKANRIVAISDMTSHSIKTLFPAYTAKLVEIPNGIDIERVKSLAQCAAPLSIQHPAIVYVGRLDGNKNPMRALEILKCVHRRKAGVHLYFIGNGELEELVRAAVTRDQLHDYVHFLGYIDNPLPLVRQAAVLIMTSRSEGFPISLLESVALGIPFVSTEVGGARELSNHQTCGLVIEDDEAAAEAILSFLSAKEGDIRQRCEDSISRFAKESYLEKIEALFASVLDEDLYTVDTIPIRRSELADRPYYYQFPTFLIKKDQRLVLYGAGRIGKDYSGFIGATGYCDLTLWVDRRFETYREKGMEVSGLGELNKKEYDLILIAVADPGTAAEVKKDLIALGILEEKIVWSVPRFM